MTVAVAAGYVLSDKGRAIPQDFWTRLKARFTPAQLRDFTAEYHAERAEVRGERASRGADLWSGGTASELTREERLFRRWVEVVCGPQAIWPWDRGWTDELAAAYLEGTDDRSRSERAPGRGVAANPGAVRDGSGSPVSAA